MTWDQVLEEGGKNVDYVPYARLVQFVSMFRQYNVCPPETVTVGEDYILLRWRDDRIEVRLRK